MTKSAEPFEREERFIVVKRKHLSHAKEEALRTYLYDDQIDTVECVVVESDWPEYEAVWRMIEARCISTPAARMLAGDVEAMRAACIAAVRAEQKYEGSDFPVCNAIVHAIEAIPSCLITAEQEALDALKSIQRLKRSIMIDVGSCHSMRGQGASSEMRSDDRSMREDIETAFAKVDSVIAGLATPTRADDTRLRLVHRAAREFVDAYDDPNGPAFVRLNALRAALKPADAMSPSEAQP